MGTTECPHARYPQMPRQLNKLLQTDVNSAKPRQKPYKLADGGGLVLLEIQAYVSGASGTASVAEKRCWRWGTYLSTSLAEARKKREAARALLEQYPPIDPSGRRKAEKRSSSTAFRDVAEEFLSRSTASEGSVYKRRGRLDNHVFPYIGGRSTRDIDAPTLLRVLCLNSARIGIQLTSVIRRLQRHRLQGVAAQRGFRHITWC